MSKFQIGEKVKIIAPDPKSPTYSFWAPIFFNPFIGQKFEILNTFPLTLISGGITEWYLLKGCPYSFFVDWLVPSQDPLITSNLNFCQCELLKLMNKGCTCGAFLAEKFGPAIISRETIVPLTYLLTFQNYLLD